MNILCRLGKHKWHGCKCEKCGTVRDTGNEFYRGSSYGRRPSCTCEICGKVIDRNHCWFGCKCGACGKVRDEQHDFKNGVCTQCGKKIPVHLNAMTERERALLVFDDQYSPSTRMEALDSVSIDAALDAFRSLPAQEPGKRPKKGDSGVSEVTRAFLSRLSQDTLKELVSSGYWAACVYVEDTDFLIRECVKADMISDCIQNLENDRKQVILQALLENPAMKEKACLAMGGHLRDAKCRCTRCGAIAHDWVLLNGYRNTEVETYRCRYCGAKEYYQVNT